MPVILCSSSVETHYQMSTFRCFSAWSSSRKKWTTCLQTNLCFRIIPTNVKSC